MKKNSFIIFLLLLFLTTTLLIRQQTDCASTVGNQGENVEEEEEVPLEVHGVTVASLDALYTQLLFGSEERKKKDKQSATAAFDQLHCRISIFLLVHEIKGMLADPVESAKFKDWLSADDDDMKLKPVVMKRSGNNKAAKKQPNRGKKQQQQKILLSEADAVQRHANLLEFRSRVGAFEQMRFEGIHCLKDHIFPLSELHSALYQVKNSGRDIHQLVIGPDVDETPEQHEWRLRYNTGLLHWNTMRPLLVKGGMLRDAMFGIVANEDGQMLAMKEQLRRILGECMFVMAEMKDPLVLRIDLIDKPHQLSLYKGVLSVRVDDKAARDAILVQLTIPQIVGLILSLRTGKEETRVFQEFWNKNVMNLGDALMDALGQLNTFWNQHISSDQTRLHQLLVEEDRKALMELLVSADDDELGAEFKQFLDQTKGAKARLVYMLAYGADAHAFVLANPELVECMVGVLAHKNPEDDIWHDAEEDIWFESLDTFQHHQEDGNEPAHDELLDLSNKEMFYGELANAYNQWFSGKFNAVEKQKGHLAADVLLLVQELNLYFNNMKSGTHHKQWPTYCAMFLIFVDQLEDAEPAFVHRFGPVYKKMLFKLGTLKEQGSSLDFEAALSTEFKVLKEYVETDGKEETSLPPQTVIEVDEKEANKNLADYHRRVLALFQKNQYRERLNENMDVAAKERMEAFIMNKKEKHSSNNIVGKPAGNSSSSSDKKIAISYSSSSPLSARSSSKANSSSSSYFKCPEQNNKNPGPSDIEIEELKKIITLYTTIWHYQKKIWALIRGIKNIFPAEHEFGELSKQWIEILRLEATEQKQHSFFDFLHELQEFLLKMTIESKRELDSETVLMSIQIKSLMEFRRNVSLSGNMIKNLELDEAHFDFEHLDWLLKEYDAFNLFFCAQPSTVKNALHELLIGAKLLEELERRHPEVLKIHQIQNDVRYYLYEQFVKNRKDSPEATIAEHRLLFRMALAKLRVVEQLEANEFSNSHIHTVVLEQTDLLKQKIFGCDPRTMASIEHICLLLKYFDVVKKYDKRNNNEKEPAKAIANWSNTCGCDITLIAEQALSVFKEEKGVRDNHKLFFHSLMESGKLNLLLSPRGYGTRFRRLDPLIGIDYDENLLLKHQIVRELIEQFLLEEDAEKREQNRLGIHFASWFRWMDTELVKIGASQPRALTIWNNETRRNILLAKFDAIFDEMPSHLEQLRLARMQYGLSELIQKWRKGAKVTLKIFDKEMNINPSDEKNILLWEREKSEQFDLWLQDLNRKEMLAQLTEHPGEQGAPVKNNQFIHLHMMTEQGRKNTQEYIARQQWRTELKEKLNENGEAKHRLSVLFGKEGRNEIENALETGTDGTSLVDDDKQNVVKTDEQQGKSDHLTMGGDTIDEKFLQRTITSLIAQFSAGEKNDGKGASRELPESSKSKGGKTEDVDVISSLIDNIDEESGGSGSKPSSRALKRQRNKANRAQKSGAMSSTPRELESLASEAAAEDHLFLDATTSTNLSTDEGVTVRESAMGKEQPKMRAESASSSKESETAPNVDWTQSVDAEQGEWEKKINRKKQTKEEKIKFHGSSTGSSSQRGYHQKRIIHPPGKFNDQQKSMGAKSLTTSRNVDLSVSKQQFEQLAHQQIVEPKKETAEKAIATESDKQKKSWATLIGGGSETIASGATTEDSGLASEWEPAKVDKKKLNKAVKHITEQTGNSKLDGAAAGSNASKLHHQQRSLYHRSDDAKTSAAAAGLHTIEPRKLKHTNITTGKYKTTAEHIVVNVARIDQQTREAKLLTSSRQRDLSSPSKLSVEQKALTDDQHKMDTSNTIPIEKSGKEKIMPWKILPAVNKPAVEGQITQALKLSEQLKKNAVEETKITAAAGGKKSEPSQLTFGSFDDNAKKLEVAKRIVAIKQTELQQKPKSPHKNTGITSKSVGSSSSTGDEPMTTPEQMKSQQNKQAAVAAENLLRREEEILVESQLREEAGKAVPESNVDEKEQRPAVSSLISISMGKQMQMDMPAALTVRTKVGLPSTGSSNSPIKGQLQMSSTTQQQEHDEVVESLRELLNKERALITTRAAARQKNAVEELQRIVHSWSNYPLMEAILLYSGSYLLQLHTTDSDIDCIVLWPFMGNDWQSLYKKQFFGNYGPHGQELEVLCNLESRNRSCPGYNKSLYCKLCRHTDVTNLRKLEGRDKIPMIEMKFHGFDFDLLFVTMPMEITDKIVNTWIQYQGKVPPSYYYKLKTLLTNTSSLLDRNIGEQMNADFIDWMTMHMTIDNKDGRKGMLWALSGYRANMLVKQLLAEKPKETNASKEQRTNTNFQLAYLALKLWTKNHSIYGGLFGLLNGTTLTMMLLKVFLEHPKDSVPALLFHFFDKYATWEWPKPVEFDKVLSKRVIDSHLDWSEGREKSDRFNLFRQFEIETDKTKEKLVYGYLSEHAQLVWPVIVPGFPTQNAAFNINGWTKQAIVEEFGEGLAQMQCIQTVIKAELTTPDLPTMKEHWASWLGIGGQFQEKYNHYVAIVCAAETAEQMRTFCSNVESGIRQQLLFAFGKLIELIKWMHASPEKVRTDVPCPSSDEEMQLPAGGNNWHCTIWLVGVKLVEGKEHQDLHKILGQKHEQLDWVGRNEPLKRVERSPHEDFSYKILSRSLKRQSSFSPSPRGSTVDSPHGSVESPRTPASMSPIMEGKEDAKESVWTKYLTRKDLKAWLHQIPL